MSDVLGRIEAREHVRANGQEMPWVLLTEDEMLALVAVASAARERRDAQIDATHYHQYDPACPCCIAQDKEWAALARLDGAR